ncbi:phage portal protein [Lyticum sinuosum]|uniref:Phage portal protein n=1 Tax=Lyticum sinuosum TaxID=1332059 RepID=A0AAE4VMC5_9RICK|nr:phage portal protein [Lyticum sinuosum]MDZ5761334.1 Phage portal protein [Lyticum sinuosum]
MFNKISNISNVFSRSQNKSLNEEMHDNSYFYNIGKPVWSGKSYIDLAKNGYCQNAIAYRTIDMLAKAAASIPLKLYKEINDGEMIPITNHKIINILRSPNPLQGCKEFFEALYTSLLISGNVYILGIYKNNPKNILQEIYLLRPDRVQIIVNNNKIPYAYRYTVDGNNIDYPIDQRNDVCKILHLRNYHPLSDWYGLSPLEVASFSIDQHNQASAWNQSLLQNGARPSGAIIVKNAQGQGCRLNPEQFSQLKSMFDDIYSGSKNAGRPLLLEGGLEWKTISMSPHDMDYLELKNSLAREIALALGVPSQLLGIPGDNTYSNLSEARTAMWEQTILPMVEKIICCLQNWFIKHFNDESIRIVCDIDKINALQPKREIIWDKLKNNNFMTINEKRQFVGLSEVDNGDIFN